VRLTYRRLVREPAPGSLRPPASRHDQERHAVGCCGAG
jgi:hypothetical protein